MRVSMGARAMHTDEAGNLRHESAGIAKNMISKQADVLITSTLNYATFIA